MALKMARAGNSTMRYYSYFDNMQSRNTRGTARKGFPTIRRHLQYFHHYYYAGRSNAVVDVDSGYYNGLVMIAEVHCCNDPACHTCRKIGILCTDNREGSNRV
jgi:hypothetical protein